MQWHIFDFNFEISRHLPFKLQMTAPICYSNQNRDGGRFWSSILSATKFRNLQETFLNYSGNTCFSLTISGCITYSGKHSSNICMMAQRKSLSRCDGFSSAQCLSSYCCGHPQQSQFLNLTAHRCSIP